MYEGAGENSGSLTSYIKRSSSSSRSTLYAFVPQHAMHPQGSSESEPSVATKKDGTEPHCILATIRIMPEETLRKRYLESEQIGMFRVSERAVQDTLTDSIILYEAENRSILSSAKV